jgi:beta-glucosidase
MTVVKVAAITLVNFAILGSGAPAKGSDGFIAAPYYPAPYGGWVEDWADSYARAKKLVDSMTLAEKTNITSGTGIYMGMSERNQ